MRRIALILAVAMLPAALALAQTPNRQDRPNIIFLMIDDAGVGDFGCYGQKLIRTPNVDRLAAEGTRYTQCYSGSAVCAPTRCALMTGMHTGHCTRRDNLVSAHRDDFLPDRPLVFLGSKDVTVATLLKKAGYATGGIGKWGLGNPGSAGVPSLHGFDYFYGYLDQLHAHTYYTDELWLNDRMVPIPENADGKRRVYSHDLFADATLEFIRAHHDQPFFLYLPWTVPHGDFEVPDDAPYSDQPWSQTLKNYAAMITRADRDLGRMMKLLKELGLDEKTIVFFTSDNGPNLPFVKQFGSAAGLRGFKRDLYEGGIRAPMIVRWPGKVAAGAVSDFVWTHIDFMPTALELTGAPVPENLDGMSVLPTLLGNKQKPHEFIYWEIHSLFHQAVRTGDFKAVRFGTKNPIELYDLTTDEGETKDIAKQHRDVVKKIAAYMETARTDNKYWPTVERSNKRNKVVDPIF